MIDTVASILAPLLGLAGSAGADAAVSMPFDPPAAGNLALTTRPGLLAASVLPSIQFAAPVAAVSVPPLITALAQEPLRRPARNQMPTGGHRGLWRAAPRSETQERASLSGPPR